MGAQLNEAEALEVATQIKKDPASKKACTDYLTEEEKEAVEVALKYLYAADKAMRTYWIKIAYLDKQRAAYQAQCKATSACIRTIAQTTRATNMVIGYESILNRATKNLTECTRNEVKVINGIRKQIDSLYADYLHEVRAAKGFDSRKLLRSKNSITNLNTLVEMNRYILSNGIKDPFAEEDLKEAKAARVKLAKSLEATSPGLAKATTYFYKQFDRITESARKAFNVPTSMDKLGYRVETEVSNKKAWQDTQVEMNAKAWRAEQEAKQEQERLQLAGKWYLVAAMGDALTELAQSLTY